MSERTRIYPKDHSWKRWKVVARNRVYRIKPRYFRTYMMARLHAFFEWTGRDFMESVDIIDQKAQGDD